MEISVKNHTDVLIFRTTFCVEATQKALMRQQKSHMRVSVARFLTLRFGMEIKNGQSE